MLAYPHFAVQNLFLKNGYRVFESDYGDVHEYDDEDALEECVGHVLALLPERLNGAQFRFLRRGLGFSQDDLAKYLDRDAQTVARIEKSSRPVPAPVDLVLRSLYLNKVSPDTTTKRLISTVYSTAHFGTAKIVLSHLGSGLWVHSFEGPTVHLEARAAPMFTQRQTVLLSILNTRGGFALDEELDSSELLTNWAALNAWMTKKTPLTTEVAETGPTLFRDERIIAFPSNEDSIMTKPSRARHIVQKFREESKYAVQ